MSESEQAPTGDSIQDAVAKLNALVQPDSSPEEQTENPNQEVEQEMVSEEIIDEEVTTELQTEDEQTEDSSEEEQTEESESEFLTEGLLQIDGESVSLEEAKLGYLRQSDYTKKTQAIAEERKSNADRKKTYESTLNALLNAAGADLSRFNGVNWEKAALDTPEQYSQAKAEYDRTRQMYDWLEGQAKQQKEQDLQDARAKAEESKTVLRHTIPNWGTDLYRDIGKYAVSGLGVSQEEFNLIDDHRVISALHKAMLYDRAATVTNKKVKSQGKKTLSSKKATPPAVGRSEAYRKSRAKLKDSGKISDAVDALSNLMNR